MEYQSEPHPQESYCTCSSNHTVHNWLFQLTVKLFITLPVHSGVSYMFQSGLGGTQMMVDKTGVGPDGEDVAAEPEASDTEDNAEQDNADDSPCPSLKHEDSIVSGDKGPYSR